MGVSREDLFEEVWAEPMLKVAARHGVSSSFLARVCERLNVPHPGRGYWAQLEVGKAAPKPVLPEPRAGDELEWAREGQPRRFFRPEARVSKEFAMAVCDNARTKDILNQDNPNCANGQEYSLSDEGLAPVVYGMMPALTADYALKRKTRRNVRGLRLYETFVAG